MVEINLPEFIILVYKPVPKPGMGASNNANTKNIELPDRNGKINKLLFACKRRRPDLAMFQPQEARE